MTIYRSGLPFTAPGRRRGRLNKNKGTLAYARVVGLPFDLATVYAAAQNFRIDLAKAIHPSTKVWPLVQDNYLREALECMQEQGCNLYPGDNDEPWIHVRTVGIVPIPSPRAQTLSSIFDQLFERDNTNLFKSEYFPRPEAVNSDEKIAQLKVKINHKFVYH
jgi:hypothetical protein